MEAAASRHRKRWTPWKRPDEQSRLVPTSSCSSAPKRHRITTGIEGWRRSASRGLHCQRDRQPHLRVAAVVKVVSIVVVDVKVIGGIPVVGPVYTGPTTGM